MRPDEHKKKKNTAYKKKHGIGIGNKNSSENNAGDKMSKKEHKRGKQEDDANHSEPRHSHSSKDIPNAAVGVDSSGSDSEVVEKKNFRRREIVSNWRKYDLEPEGDDTVTSRGENFEKLLNMAGEAMSRFRFKDELEWEEEEDGEGVEQNLAGSGALSLDLADIVSSISCIPVHQLLGIDQTLFPTDQLESHIQSVNEKRKLYNNAIKQQEQSKSVMCDTSKDSTINFKDISSSSHNKVNKKHIVDKTEKMSDSLKRDTDQRLATHDHGKDVPFKGTETSSEESTKKESSHSELSIGLMDEDLDQLLDLDVGQEKTTGALLSGTHTNSTDETTKCLSTAKKDTEKEADELEDWLDSILD